MWGSRRALFTSLVNTAFIDARRCGHSDATATSGLVRRIPVCGRPVMESFPLPSLPSPLEEESRVPGGADVPAQLRETAIQDGKCVGDQNKKKKNKHKKRRSHSNESGKSLLCQMPFTDVDIASVFEITRPVDKKMKKKRKRHQLESQDGDNSKKQKRANYFVSMPITNSKIHEDIQTIQDSVIKKDDRLSRAMIPKGSYHITLFVMYLAGEEEVQLAANALLQSKKTVEEILQERVLVLSFSGLADFKHEVVYAHTTEGDPITTLKRITETMGKIFEENGICVTGSKDFVPHLTLMKLSRAPKLHRQGIKKIDSSLYKDFQQHHFGEEVFQQVDLCSMLKKRQPSGYYHTEASICFRKKNNDGNTQTIFYNELKPLLDKIKDIKAMLALPGTRANIHRELFGIQPSYVALQNESVDISFGKG